MRLLQNPPTSAGTQYIESAGNAVWTISMRHLFVGNGASLDITNKARHADTNAPQILVSSINRTLTHTLQKERRPKAPPFDLGRLTRSARLTTATHDAETNQSRAEQRQ